MKKEKWYSDTRLGYTVNLKASSGYSIYSRSFVLLLRLVIRWGDAGIRRTVGLLAVNIGRRGEGNARIR